MVLLVFVALAVGAHAECDAWCGVNEDSVGAGCAVGCSKKCTEKDAAGAERTWYDCCTVALCPLTAVAQGFGGLTSAIGGGLSDMVANMECTGRGKNKTCRRTTATRRVQAEPPASPTSGEESLYVEPGAKAGAQAQEEEPPEAEVPAEAEEPLVTGTRFTRAEEDALSAAAGELLDSAPEDALAAASGELLDSAPEPVDQRPRPRRPRSAEGYFPRAGLDAEADDFLGILNAVWADEAAKDAEAQDALESWWQGEPKPSTAVLDRLTMLVGRENDDGPLDKSSYSVMQEALTAWTVHDIAPDKLLYANLLRAVQEGVQKAEARAKA